MSKKKYVKLVDKGSIFYDSSIDFKVVGELPKEVTRETEKITAAIRDKVLVEVEEDEAEAILEEHAEYLEGLKISKENLKSPRKELKKEYEEKLKAKDEKIEELETSLKAFDGVDIEALRLDSSSLADVKKELETSTGKVTELETSLKAKDEELKKTKAELDKLKKA